MKTSWIAASLVIHGALAFAALHAAHEKKMRRATTVSLAEQQKKKEEQKKKQEARREAEEARKQAAENRKQELHQWAVLLAEAKFTHQEVLTSGARLPQILAQMKEEACRTPDVRCARSEEDQMRAQEAA